MTNSFCDIFENRIFTGTKMVYIKRLTSPPTLKLPDSNRTDPVDATKSRIRWSHTIWKGQNSCAHCFNFFLTQMRTNETERRKKWLVIGKMCALSQTTAKKVAKQSASASQKHSFLHDLNVTKTQPTEHNGILFLMEKINTLHFLNVFLFIIGQRKKHRTFCQQLLKQIQSSRFFASEFVSASQQFLNCGPHI